MCIRDRGVDRLLVAVHDVHDAIRQASLTPQLGDRVDRGRVLLRRLDDDGVTASDRDGDKPHRHHGREVERRDDPHEAPGLEDRKRGDIRRHVLREAAPEPFPYTPTTPSTGGSRVDLVVGGRIKKKKTEQQLT